MKPLGLVWDQIERGGVDALYYKALIHEYSLYTTTDEVIYFDGSTNYYTLKGKTSVIGRSIQWGLGEAEIVTGSLYVKDEDDNIFTEGTDYTVDYETGILTRKVGKAIPLRQNVYATYKWKIRCVETSTGNPRMDCPQCGGMGFIWDDPIMVKGLFHIPNYDSPLTRIGYFETGDAIFTVSANQNFGAGPQGIDNLYLRDRIDVAGDSWRIMFKPQTIQMHNNYIAKKLHLRRLKLTPGTCL